MHRRNLVWGGLSCLATGGAAWFWTRGSSGQRGGQMFSWMTTGAKETTMHENISDKTGQVATAGKTEQATFAAGCFWGVEATFRKLPGVIATQVGYTGGQHAKPTYRDVCSDTTGHAEAVQVEYDPEQVRYEQLLEIFWANHDPTTRNRQGPDIGSQYRSAVFYHSPEQKAAAEAFRSQLAASGRFRRPIVTEIQPATQFHRAEAYHQQYLEKRGLASCHVR